MASYGSTYANSMSNYHKPVTGRLPEKSAFHSSFSMRTQRRRMNLVAMILCVLLPWSIFSVIYAVLSSTLHYERFGITCTVVALGLLVVLVLLQLAVQAARQKVEHDPNRQPNWNMFLFVTACFAWILAVIAGNINYYSHTLPFMSVQNLNSYNMVDTTITTGQHLMDAGTVIFAPDTHLDITRSLGFRNEKIYCVAPIVTGNKTASSYDFWAVGTNCCSGVRADFHCKGYNNPEAIGGLRLMRDEDRPFYRLAVQQAEATYSINANHPLFFEWQPDPAAVVNSWQETAMQNALVGSGSFLLLQLFLVASAAIAFSTLGYQ